MITSDVLYNTNENVCKTLINHGLKLNQMVNVYHIIVKVK